MAFLHHNQDILLGKRSLRVGWGQELAFAGLDPDDIHTEAATEIGLAQG
jgi:hypothetical protein